MNLNIRVVVLALFVMTVSAYGQDSGAIQGHTSDASGANIPGVGITLTSDRLMGERTTISDETGAFRFILLPPGSYNVKFELPGFKTLIHEAILVTINGTTTLNISLQVASLSETVTVTGESPMVDVTAATVGVNFNHDLLTKLPNARDMWVTLAQTPGIQVTSFDVGGSRAMTQTGYRANGATAMNWINLDGVINNSSSSGVAAYTDYGAYQEIQISAAANGAEVPSPGVYMNTVVKQGGNDLHGEAYLDWENDKFQSNNLTDALRQRGVQTGDQFVRYNDFNASIGGPIKQNKFWYFLSWRDQYSALRTQLLQGNGAQGALFPTRIQDPTIKLNYQLTPRDQLIFMGQGGRKWQPNRGGSGANAAYFNEDSTGTQDGWSWLAKTQWTRVVSPTVTFDASLNNMGLKYSIITHVFERSFRDLTTRTVRGGFSGENTGFSTTAPSRINRVRWNPKLSLTQFAKAAGSHNLKYGYEYTVYWDRVNSKSTIGDAIYYTSNGVPSFIEKWNTPFTAFDGFKQHAAFVQDKWTVGKHLTLNLGVRLDRYENYSRGASIPERKFAPAQNIAPYKVVPAFRNIVPRLGLAYDVFGTGKTAFKMSYGRYAWYAHNDISKAINPNTLIVNRYSWNDANRDREFQESELTFVQRLSSPNRRVDPNLKNTYSDEYTASLDQEIAAGLQARVSFIRIFEKNLYQIVNAAIPVSAYTIPVTVNDPGRDGVAGTGDDRQLQFFGVDARYRGLQDLVLTNTGASNNFTTYNFTLTKRMTHKWQLLGGYTLIRRNRWEAASTTTDVGGLSNDLNQRLYPGIGTGDTAIHSWEWEFQMAGTYELPRGISISSVLKSQKGQAYNRAMNYSDVLRASPTILSSASSFSVEPFGTFFLPAVTIWDMRVDKQFTFGDRHKLNAMFDLFNVPNASTILAVDRTTGVNFNKRVTQILNPRIFRLGVRYSF